MYVHDDYDDDNDDDDNDDDDDDDDDDAGDDNDDNCCILFVGFVWDLILTSACGVSVWWAVKRHVLLLL